jgi:two-component system response regulator HydG
MHNVRVLIVEDGFSAAHALAASLARDGYAYELVGGSRGALETIKRVPCDVIVCPVRANGMNRFELLDRLKRTHPEVQAIVAGQQGTIEEAVDATKHGAFHYVAEPFDPGELRTLVVRAIDAQHAPPRFSHGAHEALEDLPEIVQESPAMRALGETISLIAASTAPVLVLGESGTGKERVARAIHARSARHGRPFVALNTSAIPEQLLESELFGHVRGAFTGATQARKGLLAEAEGGTLLLDEIGDMPLGLQAKFLRVLSFNEARPVGSDRTRHVDVRVIAATHHDLDALVREGRFREDLHYRLNVLPLVVPPLRERREDVRPLVRDFLENALRRTPRSPVESISDAALGKLEQAPWPGNVRELESAIERLVVLGRSATVTEDDLAFLDAPEPLSRAGWKSATEELWTLKEVNACYVAWVLARTGGNKAKAAEILGVDLSTLYRWQRSSRMPKDS